MVTLPGQFKPVVEPLGFEERIAHGEIAEGNWDRGEEMARMIPTDGEEEGLQPLAVRIRNQRLDARGTRGPVPYRMAGLTEKQSDILSTLTIWEPDSLTLRDLEADIARIAFTADSYFDWSQSGLYGACQRLEARGLVTSYREHGYRRRYSLTEAGREALSAWMDEWDEQP